MSLLLAGKLQQLLSRLGNAANLDNADAKVSLLSLTAPNWRFQLLLVSGNWVCPAANTNIRAIIIGAGGGGSGGYASSTYGSDGSAGGATTLGSLATANGGGGGVAYDGSNAASARGGGGYNTGRTATVSSGNHSIDWRFWAPGYLGFGTGGQGGGTYAAGGGSGYIAEYAGTVSTDQYVTIGAGGAAGAGGDSYSWGSHGFDGAALLWWQV